MTVYRGDVAGHLGPPLVTAVPRRPTCLVAADLAGGSAAEVVTSGAQGSVVLRWFEGVPTAFATPVTPAQPLFASHLRDTDGDDLPELLGHDGRRVVQHRGVAGGGFDSVIGWRTAAIPRFVATTSEAPGPPDVLVVAGAGRSAIVRHRRAPSGTLETFVSVPGGGPVVRLATGDLDGDGVTDLVLPAVADGTSQVLVHLGVGDGSFLPPDVHPFSMPVDVGLADLDADGALDVVVASGAGVGSFEGVQLAPGLGDGGLGRPLAVAAAVGPFAVDVADLGGDGWIDVVTGDRAPPGVSVWRGGPGLAVRPPVTRAVPDPVLAVVVADLDADGAPDVVAASGGDTLVRLLGDGAGGLGPVAAFRVADGARAVAAADLDADGDTDLVAAAGLENTLTVLFNHGGGTFPTRLDLDTGFAPLAVRVGDVDGDGRADIVAMGPTLVTLFRGRAGGGFGGREDHAHGASRWDLGLEDGDGDLDVLCARDGAGPEPIVDVLLGRRLDP